MCMINGNTEGGIGVGGASSVSWKRQGLQNKIELAKKRNEMTLREGTSMKMTLREGTSMSKGLRVRETLNFWRPRQPGEMRRP